MQVLDMILILHDICWNIVLDFVESRFRLKSFVLFVFYDLRQITKITYFQLFAPKMSFFCQFSTKMAPSKLVGAPPKLIWSILNYGTYLVQIDWQSLVVHHIVQVLEHRPTFTVLGWNTDRWVHASFVSSGFPTSGVRPEDMAKICF